MGTDRAVFCITYFFRRHRSGSGRHVVVGRAGAARGGGGCARGGLAAPAGRAHLATPPARPPRGPSPLPAAGSGRLRAPSHDTHAVSYLGCL